jgi:hypothetical protein
VKVIVSIGYTDYVFDAPDAIALMAMLDKAEIYQSKYAPKEEGGTTHYIYPQETDRITALKCITDDLYRVAKLAGKPEKN